MLPYSTCANKPNKTIYINPNFKGQLPTPESTPLQTSNVIPKKAHINPLFLKTCKYRNTIHMNPAFLQKFREYAEQDREVPKAECDNLVSHPKNIVSISSSDKTVPAEVRRIICKSKNCLIREPLTKNVERPVRPPKSSLALQPLIVLNKRKLIRKVPALPEAFNTSEPIGFNDCRKTLTKYKLDNRLIKKKPLLPPTPRIKRTCFVARYALKRNSVSETLEISPKKSVLFSQNKNKKLQVLNINGLIYRSTRNSLKLNNITSNQIFKTSKTSTKSEKPFTNINQGLSIFVRGNKYVMDANKFKLTRVTDCDNVVPTLGTNNNFSKSSTCKRIDIGGYTFVSINSAKNVLIRTTNHLSRAYVHNAKQKSLHTLTKRLVKTNIPCPIFQRIGKCAAFERGRCSKVHNKLQVAICSKFLRAECHDANCLLSHNVSLSKMPVCKFYLQGVCVRSDCPYLHKKLSNTAELCTDFLRGFCQMAEKCNKRHEFICPEVERNNECSIKNCPYCNAKKRKESQTKLKSAKLKNEDGKNAKLFTNGSSVEVTENQSCERYFLKTSEKTIVKTEESKEEITKEEADNNMDTIETFEENSENIIIEGRPKLGTLPAYIPL